MKQSDSDSALALDVARSNAMAEAAGTRPQEAGCMMQRKLRIAMVSDFFFPNVGGVEGHIYMLSQYLRDRGHKVIVITHAYQPDRIGIRYVSSGLKVYYVPFQVIARQDTLPNFFALFPLLRSILIREKIDMVHAHQALSSMGLEALLHARTLGLRTIFTDHSLFGFADTASILTNKLLSFFLADVDHVICVSHIAKENTTLRAKIQHPQQVFVIPNAIIAEHFHPNQSAPPSLAGKRPVTIVVLSRLMHRKGIDLLLGAIPRLCALHPTLQVIIGGEGPKRVELEQMRERYALHDRVELCGAIRGGQVRNHLARGDIFLNTSLTEAFGTGIVEAASCGLFVVSTKVGGIPEVLPPDMIRLVLPDEDDIVASTHDAIQHIQAGKHSPHFYHESLKNMYSWADTAARVERVYHSAHARSLPSFVRRLEKYRAVGPVAGLIFCIIATVDMLFLALLQYLVPIKSIDVLNEDVDSTGTTAPHAI